MIMIPYFKTPRRNRSRSFLMIKLFTLEPGDLLFTGTPAGVGPLKIGERVEAGIDGLEPCRFEVGPMLPPTT